MSDISKMGIFTDENLRELDTKYKSFPAFVEWLEKTNVDTTRWNRYTQLLNERKTASPELLKEAQEIVKRAAAIDTGQIENLYELPQGFTITVAMQNTFLQTIDTEISEEARNLVESQIEAYDYVLDLVTKRTRLTEVSIRELHEVICRSQDTYRVYTPVGLQDLPLPKGQYKASPNHVLGRDGQFHAFAPVDITPAEVYRFLEELRSETFEKAHPVLQAAYAHYAFILIHPFSDGNGRVARVLASIFTYRSQSIPLLILMENKADYLDALASADNGNYQSFVDFVLERTLDSIQLIDDSLRTATTQPLHENLQKVISLSKTKGGYSHTEVDKGAQDLLDKFGAEFQKQLEIKLEKYNESLSYAASFGANSYGVDIDNYRNLVQRTSFHVEISTSLLPRNSSVSGNFDIIVPLDSDTEDDIAIRKISRPVNLIFMVRASQIIPRVSSVTQMRLAMFIETIISEMIAELEQKARQSLGRL